MAQEINETGIILKMMERNTVFNKRLIRNISIIDGDKVLVDISKISDEGDVAETIEVTFQDFENTVEPLIWELIDNQKEVVEEIGD